MKRSCAICGRIHGKWEECPRVTAKKRRKLTPAEKEKMSETREFRSGGDWKEKAKEIKERDGWMCVYCAAQGKYNPRNLEVHHIKKLFEDMEKCLDDEYLITLCRLHHKAADAGRISEDVLLELVRQKENLQ